MLYRTLKRFASFVFVSSVFPSKGFKVDLCNLIGILSSFFFGICFHENYIIISELFAHRQCFIFYLRTKCFKCFDRCISKFNCNGLRNINDGFPSKYFCFPSYFFMHFSVNIRSVKRRFSLIYAFFWPNHH